MTGAMIPLHKVFMAPGAADRVADVLRSGYVGQGDAVAAFEECLRGYLGSPHVVAVNSATSGLQLALHLLDLPAGGEVLTTPLTCMATTCAIVANRLTPVWVDVDPETLNFDLDDLVAKITPRTGAIMAVHFAGNPLPLGRLYEISLDYRLPVVEDCAHALGTRHHGRCLGTFQDPDAPPRVGVYSFQAIKPLTTGDGGALIVPARLADRARRLAWYGIDRDTRSRPVLECGFKYHMNNVAAAIGLANLPHLGAILEAHAANARAYDLGLAPGAGVRLPATAGNRYLYPVLVDKRDEFVRHLASRGIEAGPVHSRNDLEPCFAGLRNRTPGLDSCHDRLACLPVGWWLSEADRARVVTSFNEVRRCIDTRTASGSGSSTAATSRASSP